MKIASPLGIALLALVACTDRATPPASDGAGSPTAAVPAFPTDQRLGQWTGPEGTFLRIAGGKGQFKITIQDLDGPRSFDGRGVGEEIRFERDGRQETILPTDGVGTGMKWLRDKSNCLTVRFGEGYCRD